MQNRLANATSPYLLQHAGNPVDWYEWGEEALERARREDRPILLSVGYAACHWCHVMERESFENENVARLMNEHFVCIKVDREERPDVDAIYMDALQAMTGQGGWPMTVFLAPDGKPFFAGTYFPPEDHHGRPGFRRVLAAVAAGWREDRERILAQGDKVIEAISQVAATGNLPGSETLEHAVAGLRSVFDSEHGGFGGAPKFPQPMTLEFLLRMHLRGEDGALEMVTTTLDHMATGGIHDLLGGGFHRYSTDGEWRVPHFEKMLYDNAQLAQLYLHAFQVTGRDPYRMIATETLDYLLRELRHPDGGFFSSQDADSEGEEGRFYLWRREELVELAGEAWAGKLGAGPDPEDQGLALAELFAEAGDLLSLYQDAVASEAYLETKRRLSLARERRVRPPTDDKVLAAWNGLAIRAFAETGRALGESKYVDAAMAAADFVLSKLRRDDGRLLRAWREGRASGPGYLDDYACMADACLTLYETTFDPRWFEEARSLTDDLLRLFRDPEGEGFFQTGADAEALVIRPKELFDNAVPSGNSVAAEVLQRIALLTGEKEYEEAAASALRAVAALLPRAPSMFGHALSALDLYLGPASEIAIVGDREERRPLVEAVWTRYLPNSVLAAMEPGDDRAAKTIPLLEGKVPVDGRAAAYVCESFACKQPVTGPDALVEQLPL